jgi:hypothetical protein
VSFTVVEFSTKASIELFVSEERIVFLEI